LYENISILLLGALWVPRTPWFRQVLHPPPFFPFILFHDASFASILSNAQFTVAGAYGSQLFLVRLRSLPQIVWFSLPPDLFDLFSFCALSFYCFVELISYLTSRELGAFCRFAARLLAGVIPPPRWFFLFDRLIARRRRHFGDFLRIQVLPFFFHTWPS